MPDPNTEHGLRVQLATALRERDGWNREAGLLRDALVTWQRNAEKTAAERDAARAEVKRLREALSRITEHPYANGRQLCEMARAALAAPEAGEEGSGDAHAWNAGSWFDG